MIPKEKAKELYEKFDDFGMDNCYVIQCALICVKEIQQFGNQQGIREPMMFLGMVKKELLKL